MKNFRTIVPTEALESRILLAVPAAATNVNAVAAAINTNMFVSWTDNSTDETGFRIERNASPTEAADQWVTAGTVGPDINNFTDIGLTSGDTYSYRVFAVNADGDSATSQVGFRSYRATTRILHSPNTIIQAEAYQKQGGMQNNLTALGFFDPGNFFMIGDMDLTGVTGFTIQLATPNSGYHIEVHTGATDGPKIADIVTAPGTDFATFTPINGVVSGATGISDVYIVGAGTGTAPGIGDVDSVSFNTGGQLAGSVFNDPNSNGVKDGAETGIGAWTVYLDTNNNNAKEIGEPAQQTDATGLYAFGGLADTTYHVKQVIQTGYRKTLPAQGTAGYDVVIAGANVVVGNNFGNTTNIFLGGTAFNDVNNSGAQDAGELGVPGVVININSPAGGATIATRTTDANGKWQVKGLSAGSGEAVAVQPAGYTFGNPADGKYTGSASSGERLGNLNFALKAAGPAPFASVSILDAADASIGDLV